MDAKAVMRSRMRKTAQNRGQKLDTPLVRYNDLGQPVCNVCNLTVKSESLWTAHTLTRQHKAAVDQFKAKAAAALRRPNPSEPPKANVGTAADGARLASTLPENFFDVQSERVVDAPQSKRQNIAGHRNGDQPVNVKISSQTASQHGKQIPAAVGALPKGFFDNHDADSRAQGVEIVKINIQDEYKEFQKSIEEDVQGVDVRLEEEEFEAAEDREELEQKEQRNLLERIEAFKKRQQEKAAAVSKLKASQSNLMEVVEEEPSDDSDEDNLLVDWRAKHL